MSQYAFYNLKSFQIRNIFRYLVCVYLRLFGLRNYFATDPVKARYFCGCLQSRQALSYFAKADIQSCHGWRGVLAESVFGPTSSPSDKLFKNLRQSWPDIMDLQGTNTTSLQFLTFCVQSVVIVLFYNSLWTLKE